MLSKYKLFVLLLLLPCRADALDLSGHPDINRFIREISAKHNIEYDYLASALKEANFREDIIESMNKPKEALPWYQYKPLFVTEYAAKRGARFWRKNQDVFSRAESTYGVDPAVITAILSVETQFGRNMGNIPVMDALVTLAFNHPTRYVYFRSQLEEFFLLAREIEINPAALKGSYAGAIGIPQFMPGSYRAYGVDFNGDKKRDLIGDTIDAIGSVANFLKMHGWEPGEPVGQPADISGNTYPWIERLGIKPLLPVKHLYGYGIHFQSEDDVNEKKAALIAIEEKDGVKHYLGYNNFYVITRYNRSVNYAMAVYQLSELIRKYHKELS